MTPDDFKSPTWGRLRMLLKERLARHREENDFGDPTATAHRRGQIAEIKELLALELVPRHAVKPASSDAADPYFS